MPVTAIHLALKLANELELEAAVQTPSRLAADSAEAYQYSPPAVII
jgi:hypothetical protein